MDSIATHLAPISSRVAVPRSVPGLVTRRVMGMTYMEGAPLMSLAERVAHLPKWQREKVGGRAHLRVGRGGGGGGGEGGAGHSSGGGPLCRGGVWMGAG